MGKEPTERFLKASERFIRKVKTTVTGNYQVKDDPAGIRWHVDFPSPERPAWLFPNGWVVQGWVLLPDHLAECREKVAVVAQWATAFDVSHPLTIDRPDVVEKALGILPKHSKQLKCGFRFTVPQHLTTFSLSVVVDGECSAVKTVHMPAVTEEANQPPRLKVLEGRDGWLFLDNDTNGSVDQYCGRLRLTEEGLSSWQVYLAGLEAIAQQCKAKMAMLVAPSKESVMGPRYHPYKEGSGGPISQLLGLSGAFPFVYPVPELSAMGDDAFIQTDTHWTQQGAMAASKALAKKLELDGHAVAQRFANDRYRKRDLTGDLGNKFDPPRQCEVPILASFSYSKCRYFDNGLPNFGRLLVLVNDDALVKETCLIFGSSSSYSMFHYLCRLFHRVVFVHSAGSLDQALIRAVKPAYLVIQTNARFVVQVPSLEQSLEKMIIDKRARLSDEELEMVAKRRICPADGNALLADLNLTPWLI